MEQSAPPPPIGNTGLGHSGPAPDMVAFQAEMGQMKLITDMSAALGNTIAGI
jgi:hypothetical protein